MTPFPLEELRRIGLSREAIEWARSLHRAVEELQDVQRLNYEVLMPLSLIPIDAQLITGVTGASEQALLTAVADTSTVLKRVTITNIDSSARTFSAWIVPDGGALGNANLVIDATSLAAGVTEDSSEEASPIRALHNRVLKPGDALWIGASVTNTLSIRGEYAQRNRDR